MNHKNTPEPTPTEREVEVLTDQSKPGDYIVFQGVADAGGDYAGPYPYSQPEPPAGTNW